MIWQGKCMTIEWEEFLDPYIQAVGELKIKLRGVRKQYRKQTSFSDWVCDRTCQAYWEH